MMEDFYEFRHKPNQKMNGLAAALIGFLFAFGLLTSNPRIMAVSWGLIAMCMLWLLMKSPVAGIRVDAKHLTLSAWRNPRNVPLSDIDHIRVPHWSDTSNVTIIYKNGATEEIPYGDIPDIRTFAEVMSAVNVPLREPIAA